MIKALKHLSIIIIILIYPTHGEGQNLVRNGDFEQYYSLPTTISQLMNVKFWNYKIGKGTPDYFHTKAKGDTTKTKLTAGAPGNWFGFQKPRSGNAYVGIITTIAKDKRFTSEFIQTKLSQKLNKGKKYYLEFYISIPDGNGLDGLGILFSPQLIDSTQNVHDVKQFVPQLQIPVEKMIIMEDGWRKVSGYYTAFGDEQYLLIGNFTNYSLNVRDKLGYSANNFYSSDYYIDDIWLLPAKEQQVIEIYRSINFNNLHFEFDKATLRPESFDILDKLVALMKKNPTMRITIKGFTDNWGSYSYNLHLSLKRTETVVEYLKRKEISPSRISSIGYGYKNPVADNESEEGREENRRVEFHIDFEGNGDTIPEISY